MFTIIVCSCLALFGHNGFRSMLRLPHVLCTYLNYTYTHQTARKCPLPLKFGECQIINIIDKQVSYRKLYLFLYGKTLNVF